MTFLSQQPKVRQEEYFNLLKVMGSLSNLYSDSPVPYLYYRGHENAFCKSFLADNLSRSDASADAGKKGVGIGLKTFISQKEWSSQKIAEFNKKSPEIKAYDDEPVKLAKFVSEMRNKRVEMTKAMFDLDKMIYHCVARRENEFLIHEEPMDLIDTGNIILIKADNKSVVFTDERHEYSYLYSKSTLFKRFKVASAVPIKVAIFEDPFDILEASLNLKTIKSARLLPCVVLPLYSEKGIKHVPEKSGLNQWNAGGRQRKDREVYIPIPAWIHKQYSDFFPPRDVNFNLHLPDKKVLCAKVCQDNNKALMSNPNTDLGEWLIDDVLKLREGEIVTYPMLLNVGIDSVEISKQDDKNFHINFKKLDTYEKFKVSNMK